MAAFGCDETISAPGACPEFCPTTQIEVRDTVLFGAVERDSSFRGYVQAQNGVAIPVVSDDQPEYSRGVYRYLRFGLESQFGTGVGQLGEILSLDSVRLDLIVLAWSQDVETEVVVYRLPERPDSSTTLAAIDGFVDPAYLLASTVIPDTLESRDTLRIVIDGTDFPEAADTAQIALGLAVRGPQPTWVTLGSRDGGGGSLLTRFTQADTSAAEEGIAGPAQDVRGADFDSFVRTGLSPVPLEALVIGGTPSARSLLRLNLPDRIVDSTSIVGARLGLVPVQPATGAQRDTFRIRANALAADFGPKSPVLISLPTDSAALGTPVLVGTTDTVFVDVTEIVQGWQRNPRRPRSLMLSVSPEAGSLSELRFGSSRIPLATPVLDLTFILPSQESGT